MTDGERLSLDAIARLLVRHGACEEMRPLYMQLLMRVNRRVHTLRQQIANALGLHSVDRYIDELIACGVLRAPTANTVAYEGLGPTRTIHAYARELADEYERNVSTVRKAAGQRTRARQRAQSLARRSDR